MRRRDYSSKSVRFALFPFRIDIAVIGLLMVALGCAPNIDHLVRHYDNREFQKAVSAVRGNPKMELELALIIIGSAATREDDAFEMVDVLKGAGRAGERALERLAKRRDMTGRLAWIALADSADPESEALSLCENDAYGDVRTACTRTFFKVMDKAHLKQRLLDIDPRVRLFAIKGLKSKGEAPDIVRSFREALRQDPSSKVRAEAAAVGPLLGEDALFLLKSALEDENMGVRLSAIKGIAALKSDIGNALLMQYAVAKLDLMAVAAAAELSRIGEAIGAKRLNAALKESRPTIRKAALLRLERANITRRKERIADLLNDESPEVVLLAAALLCNDERYRKAVIEALGKVSKKSTASAAAARDKLAFLGDEEAIKAVRKALADADEDTMLQILGRIGGAVLLRDDIVLLMGDSRAAVREQAARALIRSGRVQE
jgi:HEAT repeat protein